MKYKVEYTDRSLSELEETVEAEQIVDNAQGVWVDFFKDGSLVRRFKASAVIGVKAVE